MYGWIERLRVGTRCAALPVLGLSLALAVASSAAGEAAADAAPGAVRSDEDALLVRAHQGQPDPHHAGEAGCVFADLRRE